MTNSHDKHTQATGRADDLVADLIAREPRVRKAHARYEVVRRLLQLVATVCLVACMGLLIYLAGSANAGAEAIKDCTTPGGECYERSQAQTAQVVGQIVKAQQQAVQTGSAPARENLVLTKTNAQRIQVMLAILDEEYPEAAKVARAELGVNP